MKRSIYMDLSPLFPPWGSTRSPLIWDLVQVHAFFRKRGELFEVRTGRLLRRLKVQWKRPTESTLRASSFVALQNQGRTTISLGHLTRIFLMERELPSVLGTLYILSMEQLTVPLGLMKSELERMEGTR